MQARIHILASTPTNQLFVSQVHSGTRHDFPYRTSQGIFHVTDDESTVYSFSRDVQDDIRAHEAVPPVEPPASLSSRLGLGVPNRDSPSTFKGRPETQTCFPNSTIKLLIF